MILQTDGDQKDCKVGDVVHIRNYKGDLALESSLKVALKCDYWSSLIDDVIRTAVGTQKHAAALERFRNIVESMSSGKSGSMDLSQLDSVINHQEARAETMISARIQQDKTQNP